MLNPNRSFSLEGRAKAISCQLSSTLMDLEFRNGVAFRYHEYIITSWNFHHDGKYSSAVYQYDDSNPDDKTAGRDARLVYLYDDDFDDQGEAVKTAILRAELIHSERLMKKEV